MVTLAPCPGSYDQDRERLLERIKMIFGTPALHPRLRQQQAGWAAGMAGILAGRLGVHPDDLEVRAIAAAVVAAVFVAIEEWQAHDAQGRAGRTDRPGARQRPGRPSAGHSDHAATLSRTSPWCALGLPLRPGSGRGCARPGCFGSPDRHTESGWWRSALVRNKRRNPRECVADSDQGWVH
jgi:hypothetical protein